MVNNAKAGLCLDIKVETAWQVMDSGEKSHKSVAEMQSGQHSSDGRGGVLELTAVWKSKHLTRLP